MPAQLRELIRRFQSHLAESEASDRSFGLWLGAILLAIGLLPLWKGDAVRWWAVAIAGVLAALALVAPRSLQRPKRAWLFLGFLLGLIVNPIVLGILFFVVITPAGMLMRWFGRDPLWLQAKPDLATYWRTRSGPPSDMNDQF